MKSLPPPNELTIIVNSCDAYSDVWELFFRAFEEHWPHCPYGIVLNTEKGAYASSGLNVISHNFHDEKRGDLWGRRLKKTLESISSKYVIMLFDDYILEAGVDVEKINDCVSWMEGNEKISVFYFSNIEGANVDDGMFVDFELLPRRKDYRLNSAPALWRRERLLEFTGDVDTPWAWEFFGSARTYKGDQLFYCSKMGKEDIYKYNYKLGGAIHRGRWVESVVLPVIEKYNIKLDLRLRGVEDETLRAHKRSFLWKIGFLLLGFRMVGLDAFIFVVRSIKRKLRRLVG